MRNQKITRLNSWIKCGDLWRLVQRAGMEVCSRCRQRMRKQCALLRMAQNACRRVLIFIYECRSWWECLSCHARSCTVMMTLALLLRSPGTTLLCRKGYPSNILLMRSSLVFHIGEVKSHRIIWLVLVTKKHKSSGFKSPQVDKSGYALWMKAHSPSKMSLL